MKTLNGNIKHADMLTAQSLTATTTGTAIDMRNGNNEDFDTALVTALIGAIGGDVAPTSVKVKVIESDNSNLSSSSTMEGGDEVTVSASTNYRFQVRRTKRYIGVVVTITGGTNPTVIAGATGLLTNWATPFPVVA